jgi:hypothetical protein
MCEGLCGSWRASLGIWVVCFRCLKVGLCPVAVGGGGGGSGEVRRGDVEGRGEFLPPCGNRFRLWRNRCNSARISYLNGIITRFGLV